MRIDVADPTSDYYGLILDNKQHNAKPYEPVIAVVDIPIVEPIVVAGTFEHLQSRLAIYNKKAEIKANDTYFFRIRINGKDMRSTSKDLEYFTTQVDKIMTDNFPGFNLIG